MDDLITRGKTTRRTFLKTIGATSLIALVASAFASGCSSGGTGQTAAPAGADTTGYIAVSSPTAGSTPISQLLSADPTKLAEQCGTDGVVLTIPDWKIEMNKDTVPAGKVSFIVIVTGWSPHQLQVKGPGVDFKAPLVQVAKCGTFDLDLKPGTYEIYCILGGHKDRGEKVTLTVQ